MILNFKFKSKNGVLKYLYQKNPNEYWNEVIVSASEGKPINPPSYAIDMNDSTYLFLLMNQQKIISFQYVIE